MHPASSLTATAPARSAPSTPSPLLLTLAHVIHAPTVSTAMEPLETAPNVMQATNHQDRTVTLVVPIPSQPVSNHVLLAPPSDAAHVIPQVSALLAMLDLALLVLPVPLVLQELSPLEEQDLVPIAHLLA